MITEIKDLTISETETELLPESLQQIILDSSISIDIRIKVIEDLSIKTGKKINDEIIEMVLLMCTIYKMSGSFLIKKFLVCLCDCSFISDFIKIEIAKNLLTYKEPDNSFDDEIDITKRQKSRDDEAYTILNNVLFNNQDILANSYKVESIILLMNSEKYYKDAGKYFEYFICDDKIECSYRYKMILSLEVC